MAEDHNTYRRRRHREIGYGRWQPWAADPEPVREHVRQLRAHGASYRAIAAAAGVSAMSVHKLASGSGQIKADIAAAVMGVTAERLAAQRPPARHVPAYGAMRQVRALVAAGHSYERQAAAVGCHPETIRTIARDGTAMVNAPLRRSLGQLYDAWWDKRPPERTREERTAAEAARRRAERAGWCTGAGLDDDRLDDPAYVPQAKWCRAAGTGPAPEDPLGRQQTADPAKEGSVMPFNTEASPDDGRPVVEPWEPRRVVELAAHRVAHATHHENDGEAARRQELVAGRAARAMRDGGRRLDGSLRRGWWGQLTETSRPDAAGREAWYREAYEEFEREAAATERGPDPEAEAG